MYWMYSNNGCSVVDGITERSLFRGDGNESLRQRNKRKEAENDNQTETVASHWSTYFLSTTAGVIASGAFLFQTESLGSPDDPNPTGSTR